MREPTIWSHMKAQDLSGEEYESQIGTEACWALEIRWLGIKIRQRTILGRSLRGLWEMN